VDDSIDLEQRFEASLTVKGRGRGEGGRLDPATVRVYAKYWREADEWARATGLYASATPWTSEVLALYARYLLERGYAKATADARLTGVRAGHRVRGWPVPDGVAAWYVLRAANLTPEEGSKVNISPPRRALLEAVARPLDPGTSAGARDLCILALGWDLHAGVRDLVSLDLRDVQLTEDGYRVRMERRGGVWLEVRHNHEPLDVCPVEATAAWLGTLYRYGAVDGPLFRGVDKGGNIAGLGPWGGSAARGWRLSESGVSQVWARLLVQSTVRGRTPRDLRMASALDSARTGTPIPEVLARGGWRPGNAAVLQRLVEAAAAGQEHRDSQGES
jgi:integrase